MSRSSRTRVADAALGLLAIRRGETLRALLTFSYLFLIICSYLIIKAVRSALFISEFGAMKLPYAMIGIALLAGVAASLYIRIAQWVPQRRLVVGSLLFFSSNVLVLWWLATQGFTWLYPVLYLWAGVYGVLATTQVWSLANELFTTREAKRLFGVIGSGGILGAVVGGAIASRLSPRIGSVHLLLVVAGMLLLAAAVVAWLTAVTPAGRGAAGRRTDPSPRSLSQSLGVIGRSAHLRLLAALVFITALATTSVDFQFSLVAEQAFTDRDSLAAFFGTVYGGISLIGFVVQLLLTSRLLQRYGVGVSLLVLPLALTLGTGALLVGGTLWAAVLLKGSDGAFKHSLDRSCRELLYLPLPASLKLQSKSTIDTVMDRLGDGSAGVLQALLTGALGFGLRGSLAANLAVIAVWLGITHRLRGEYVNQLRSALGKSLPRIMPATSQADDADTRALLEEVLVRGSDSERFGALEWAAAHGVSIDDDLLLKLSRNDPHRPVRNAALTMLLVGGNQTELPEEIASGLEADGGQVLVQAIELLTEEDPLIRRRRIEQLIETADPSSRLAVLALMVRRLGDEFEPFALRLFETLLDPEAPADLRRITVRALVLLPAQFSPRDRLLALLADGDHAIAAAAADVAARLGRQEFVETVVSLLDAPRHRAGLRRALIRYGEVAVPALTRVLGDSGSPNTVRREAVTLLGRIGSDDAARTLIGSLGDDDHEVRERVVDSLYRLRRNHRDLRELSGDDCKREVRRRTDAYRDLMAAEATFRAHPGRWGDAMNWMLEVLQRERAATLTRVFRILALEYSIVDMHRAERALYGASKNRRANALELLDTTMSGSLKRSLLPLLEILPTPGEERLPPARGWDLERAMRLLIGWPNPWVAACALHAARNESIPGLGAAARARLGTSELYLREEAEAYLRGTEP